MKTTQYPGVALIAGAASAQGRAVSRVLIRDGCTRLVLADTDVSTLEAAEAACQDLASIAGVTIDIVTKTCNFQEESEVDGLVSAVISRFGALDYCVNCPAADGLSEKTNKADDKDAPANISDDLGRGLMLMSPAYAWQRAVWLCMRAQITHIMKLKQLHSPGHGSSRDSQISPSIVNISATHGLASEGGGLANLCAGAHAIVGATRATAMDYVKHNIRLNCVCPGIIGQPLPLHDSEGKSITIEADDVAEAVLFLLSHKARAVTGVALPVDAGWSLYHR